MRTGLDERVSRAVTQRWPHRGVDWVSQLDAELRTVCGDLRTSVVRVFSARFAFVAEVVTEAGSLLVVKSSPAPDANHQAAVLDRLSSAGAAPPLQLVKETATAVWTVMESVRPGEPLTRDSVVREHRAAVRALLRTLATGGPGPADAPDLVPWIRDRLTDPPADDQPPGRGPASTTIREGALAMLDELRPLAPGLLCHGDLSLGNLLRSDSRLWVVDPRGLNGEPAYDVAVVALKACAGDVPRARRLAAALAGEVDIDTERVGHWVEIAAAATV